MMVDSSGYKPKTWLKIVTYIINPVAGLYLSEIHWKRNKYNLEEMPKNSNEASQLGWISSDHENGVPDNCHQFTAENYGENDKWVSPNGYYELIVDINGNYVGDPRDIGTFNYIPSGNTIQDFGHGVFDVIPWIIWGNSEDDSTNIYDRIKYSLKKG